MSPAEEIALSLVRKHKPSGPTALAQLWPTEVSKQYASKLLESLAEQGKIKKTDPVWTAV